MKIEQALLDRLMANDPGLTVVEFCSQILEYEAIAQLSKALMSNTVVTSLYLSHNKLGDKEGKLLVEGLPKSLTLLSIENNKVGDETAITLAQHKAIRTLILTTNKIDAVGATALAQMATLTHLDMENNHIGDEGAKALALNPKLINLNLINNDISDEGAIALAQCKSLVSLELTNNRISDVGAIALAQRKGLITLKLARNQIGDEGAEALARHKELVSLDLYANQIGDKGAIALAQNMSLANINLESNIIRDEGAKALARNKYFRTLFLFGNEISDELIKTIGLSTTHIDFTIGDYGSQDLALYQKITERIKQNQIAMLTRRQQFLQAILILARDHVNPASQSWWKKLPLELKLYIFSLLDYSVEEHLGKSAQQIYACAKFIFDNVEAINKLIRSKQGFKIQEKYEEMSLGESRNTFFTLLTSKPNIPLVEKQGEDNQEEPPTKKTKF